MTKLATDPKCVSARSSKDGFIDLDSQRGKRKCHIVLTNIFFKPHTMWTCAIKEISEFSWSRRERREIDLAGETTHSKFEFIYC